MRTRSCGPGRASAIGSVKGPSRGRRATGETRRFPTFGPATGDLRGREFGAHRFGRWRPFGRVAEARDFPQIFWRSFARENLASGPVSARVENFSTPPPCLRCSAGARWGSRRVAHERGVHERRCAIRARGCRGASRARRGAIEKHKGALGFIDALFDADEPVAECQHLAQQVGDGRLGWPAQKLRACQTIAAFATQRRRDEARRLANGPDISGGAPGPPVPSAPPIPTSVEQLRSEPAPSAAAAQRRSVRMGRTACALMTIRGPRGSQRRRCWVCTFISASVSDETSGAL
jgi:hypothetical protein